MITLPRCLRAAAVVTILASLGVAGDMPGALQGPIGFSPLRRMMIGRVSSRMGSRRAGLMSGARSPSS